MPTPAGQLGGVALRVLGRVRRGHRDPVHRVRPERVGGDHRGHRGVDAAGQAEDDRAEAVLADVVPGAGDQRPPDLLLVDQPLARCAGRRHRRTARSRLVRDDVPLDRHAEHRAGHGAAVARHLDVADDQQLLVLRCPGQHGPVRRDDQRVAVVDQLVLGADHVDVRDRRAGLGRPPRRQRQPHVVLVPLVRRAVDAADQPDLGPGGDRERAAVLPEVLADGQGDVDAADPGDHEPVAGHEVARLVEDAVVGQVVLEVGGRDLAAVQHGAGVARAAGGVDVADDHRELAEPGLGQPAGQLVPGPDAGRPERLAEAPGPPAGSR